MHSNDTHNDPGSGEIRLDCPAKVNLALSVGRPNRVGLHPIASWMVAVDFCDSLILRGAAGQDSSYHIEFAHDAPCPQEVDWSIDKDLTYRAHECVSLQVDEPLPVDLTLEKRIPAGSGLGGGSSNAAAMLVALNQLFRLGLDKNQLLQSSQQLGSDVRFFTSALNGQPSAIVSGTGETVEEAPLRSELHLVLILPPLRCPTAQVYEAFDRERHSGVLQGRR